jgi:hypothetical protein
MLIRFSALATAGNGLFIRLSDCGGGGGSSFSAGTGEKAEDDPSPCPNEFPYSFSRALTMSCRETGAASPKFCWVMKSVIAIRN